MDFKNSIDSYDIILGRPFLRIAGVVHDWSSHMLYLRKDTLVTKVDLTMWKSRPLGGNLFATESETTARTTTVNQFEAKNEKIMGVMRMKHGMHLYLNRSTRTIGCIYLQPLIYRKNEELTW